MTNRHFTRAEHQLEAVVAASVALREEYARPARRNDQIAALHADIGRGLKLAEIHAELAIADAVTALRPTEPRVVMGGVSGE